MPWFIHFKGHIIAFLANVMKKTISHHGSGAVNIPKNSNKIISQNQKPGNLVAVGPRIVGFLAEKSFQMNCGKGPKTSESTT